MKLKKTAAAVLSVLLCLTILGGCGKEEGGLLLKYDDCITQDGTYDTSLFYRNDLNLNHAADPDVIWVPEERDEEVRKNRRLLYHVMSAAGFVNYDGEWWHYSYGDRQWARQTGAEPVYGYCLACDI